MLLLKLAFRNILLHKLKTSVIGAIIVIGTVLAVVGNSLVDAVSTGMQKSIVQSLAGHIQIYSSHAKEKLALFGDTGGNVTDIGHVRDFRRVKETLMREIPDIQSMIPMGTNFAFINPGNVLDSKLEEYRKNEKEKSATELVSTKEHIRNIILDIQEGLPRIAVMIAAEDDPTLKNSAENMKRATSETFWSQFEAKREESLEFLANRIAPLIFDDNQLFFSFVGTSPKRFREAFSNFEIVKGEMIPDGKRGFLFSDYFYENTVKHRVARVFDEIQERITKHHETIAAEKALQDKIKTNVASAAEVYSQIDPAASRIIVPKLKSFLKSESGDLRELVRFFLNVSDANFFERFNFFYAEIAPRIRLYKMGLGEVFPLSAFAKSGFSTAVNVKVYGTYHFKSFESSPIAGNFCLLDLISFRELYGFQSDDRVKESQSLEKEMGLVDFDRSGVDALFSKKDLTKPGVAAKSAKIAVPQSFGSFKEKQTSYQQVYSDSEMENGVFLNTAIFIKDVGKVSQVIAKINEVSKKEKLEIQAIDYNEAAGLVGQLSFVVRAILFVCVAIIFAVATFIIMNSMLMAALERTKEIGTMRAIGAQRRFILLLFLNEASVLSFIFSILGSAIAVLILFWLGRVGIPAGGDVATFFFSGPRLYPAVHWIHVFVVLLAMTFISIVSTQYPAWRAMRISPIEAMRSAK